MSAKQSPLAFIATEEFTQRRADLRRAVVSQGYDSRQANRIAACWLAIAAACGADLPELRDANALRQIGIDAAAQPSRRLAADEIAPRTEWQAELQRARDTAMRRAMSNPADRHLAMRSFGLASLALHLGIAMPFGTGANVNTPEHVTNGARSAPQGQPPARSDAPTGRVSEDSARSDGRAHEAKEAA